MTDPAGNKRLTLILGTVLLGVLALIGFWSASSASPEGIETTNTAEEAQGPGPLELRSDPSVENPDRAKIETDPDQPSTDDGRPFTLLVVNGETGNPIPNHTVLFKDHYLRGESGFEEEFQAVADQLETDAEGKIDLAFADKPFSFFARKDHLIGLLRVASVDVEAEGPIEKTLKLLPELSVSIRVLDPSGAALPGITVGYKLIHGSDQPDTASDRLFQRGTMLGLTADPSGVLRWQDLGLLLHARKRAGEEIKGLTLFAYVPGDDQVARTLEVLPRHGSTIDLQLPITGDLTLALLDPLGRPIPGQGKLSISPLTQDKTTGEWKPTKGAWVTEESATEEVRFPAIALNKLFRVTPDGGFAPRTWEIQGPTSEHRSVIRKIPWDDSLALIRGRALDQSRLPLAGTNVGFAATISGVQRIKGKRQFWGTAITDQEGQFGILVPAEVAGSGLRSARASCNQAIVDLMSHDPFKPGVNELGDLVFSEEQLPILVSGKLVSDSEGGLDLFGLTIEHRASRSHEWQDTKLVHYKNGSSFSVRAEPVAGQYRLKTRLIGRSHIPLEPVEFVPGTEGLVIRLEKGHSLTVSANLPLGSRRGWSIYPLRPRLRPVSGRAMEIAADREKGIAAQGNTDKGNRNINLQWSGLLEGTYQLELKMIRDPEPLLVVPAIRVPSASGEPAKLELDISPFLKAIALTIRGPDGPLNADGVSVMHYYKGENTTYTDWSPESPHARIVPGKTNLWIKVSGYIPVFLERPTVDQDIYLSPSGQQVDISFDTSLELPENTSIRIRCIGPEDAPSSWKIPGEGTLRTRNLRSLNRSWPAEVSSMLDLTQKIRMELHRPGEQIIAVDLVPNTEELRSQWQRESIPIDDFAPKSFNLQPSAGPQRVMLQLPQSAIDAALQKAGLR